MPGPIEANALVNLMAQMQAQQAQMQAQWQAQWQAQQAQMQAQLQVLQECLSRNVAQEHQVAATVVPPQVTRAPSTTNTPQAEPQAENVAQVQGTEDTTMIAQSVPTTQTANTSSDTLPQQTWLFAQNATPLLEQSTVEAQAVDHTHSVSRSPTVTRPPDAVTIPAPTVTPTQIEPIAQTSHQADVTANLQERSPAQMLSFEAIPRDPNYGALAYDNQTTAIVHNRRLQAQVDKQVTPFNGCDEREDPFAWIFEHFETVRDRYQWTDDECLHVVSRYLLRTALAWFTSNRHRITHWYSGERHRGYQPGSFVHAFLARFVRPEMRAIWAQEFTRCKQMPGEDVTQFSDRVIALRDRVSLARLIHDDEVRDIFRNGLPLELKNQLDGVEIVLGRDRLQFEESVEMALRFEYSRRMNADTQAVTIAGDPRPRSRQMTPEIRVVTSPFTLSALIQKEDTHTARQIKPQKTIGVEATEDTVQIGIKQWQELQDKVRRMEERSRTKFYTSASRAELIEEDTAE
ncbi:hypothetical protein THASP1DRAFT_33863 [Thamnocephalis sphaerospora]|uniref:Retrotransposon gag domain-containing protein n=1 Tax=Thamnocephalis sphaerospora TaxID=78915 RepID=A0A4V1IVK5_9FUNG|nr:hypothetical protein THASP1DRAFT_33863 [Thamnocephalis sphaerospora]|eukprot:RKP04379.1 hypothetical protein THASP1DRAFT_33863 [Thamnocephalis sphaerospora]